MEVNFWMMSRHRQATLLSSWSGWRAWWASSWWRTASTALLQLQVACRCCAVRHANGSSFWLASQAVSRYLVPSVQDESSELSSVQHPQRIARHTIAAELYLH